MTHLDEVLKYALNLSFGTDVHASNNTTIGGGFFAGDGSS